MQMNSRAEEQVNKTAANQSDNWVQRSRSSLQVKSEDGIDGSSSCISSQGGCLQDPCSKGVTLL
eukprot:1154881-Pelagomonas_calceolata.AAC.7